MTKLLSLTILFLVVVPGFISFIISSKVRKTQIREEQKDRLLNKENYQPYTICLDKKYYSGYYGLVCLPVYLIAVLIGQVL
jgi:hypothetical protein